MPVSYTHLDVYKRQTFVINNDNSREVINIKEECKIKIKQSYLCSKNIQFVGYTHSIKSCKRKIRVTQLKHQIYGEKMHSKYQANDNYNNNNCNVYYKNYRDYHKPVSYTHLLSLSEKFVVHHLFKTSMDLCYSCILPHSLYPSLTFSMFTFTFFLLFHCSPFLRFLFFFVSFYFLCFLC